MMKEKSSHIKSMFPVLLFPIEVVPQNSATTASNGPVSYIVGGIVALLIMGYLIYTLLHPDKF